MPENTSERERDDAGRFSGGASTEAVYSLMDESEPYSTGEVAELVGIARRTAYSYLEQLAEQELIRKKKTDERQAIWIKPEPGSSPSSEQWDGGGWSPTAERIFSWIEDYDLETVAFPHSPPVAPSDEVWLIYTDEEGEAVGLAADLSDLKRRSLKETSPPGQSDEGGNWWTIDE